MRNKITVTAEHIKLGEPFTAEYCPIALALREKFKDAVIVGSSGYDIGTHRYPLPTRAKRFVSKFDQGKPVAPFSFFHVED